MKRLESIARGVCALLLALGLGLVQPGTAEAQAEKRLALVIGNSDYKGAPLLNPINDARAMAALLQRLGFDVVLRENATRAHIAAAIASYTARITPGTVALLYYAGHGLQVRGRNYLIPIDAEIEAESAVPFAAIDVGQISEEIDHAGARVKVMVLDACRNNPFERRLRGAGPARGLAPMHAARGSLMAFATAPGSVAADGDGANSVYTGALLKALAEPGLTAEEVFKRVRMSVLEETRGAQTPWEQSALTGDLVLHRAAAAPVQPAAVAAAPPGPADAETVFWQSVQTSNRVDEYRTYLRQYPQGAFATLARSRIAALQAQQQIAAAAQGAPTSRPSLPSLVGAAKAADLLDPVPPRRPEPTARDEKPGAGAAPDQPRQSALAAPAAIGPALSIINENVGAERPEPAENAPAEHGPQVERGVVLAHADAPGPLPAQGGGPPPAAVAAKAAEPTPSKPRPPMVAALPPAPAAAPAPNDSVAAMMRRADALAALGDLAGARLFYERLATAGHRPAALALARSYDPAWLRRHHAVGIPGDPARAAKWYARAQALAEPAETKPAPQARAPQPCNATSASCPSSRD